MPADVIGGIIGYLQPALGLSVWDGEVPRQGVSGAPIQPQAAAPDWPALDVELPESHLRREYAMMGPGRVRRYGEEGEITVVVWDVTREGVQDVLNQIEVLLEPEPTWRAIDLNGGHQGPYQFYRFLYASWTNVQEKEKRAGMSQLLYRGEITYSVGVHGNTQG